MTELPNFWTSGLLQFCYTPLFCRRRDSGESPCFPHVVNAEPFHMVLDVVGQITEEVDAGELFQRVDVDDIW